LVQSALRASQLPLFYLLLIHETSKTEVNKQRQQPTSTATPSYRQDIKQSPAYAQARASWHARWCHMRGVPSHVAHRAHHPAPSMAIPYLSLIALGTCFCFCFCFALRTAHWRRCLLLPLSAAADVCCCRYLRCCRTCACTMYDVRHESRDQSTNQKLPTTSEKLRSAA
jgi:hypothetical protein